MLHHSFDNECNRYVPIELQRGKDNMEEHGVGQLDFINIIDNTFTGRVICGECGSAFVRKT